MKQINVKTGEITELISKLEELNWKTLPKENSEKFVAGFTNDGNIIKIYNNLNQNTCKVYFNSVPIFNYIRRYEDMNKLKGFYNHFNGRRVVEIDDAGTGCPIGGIIIGIYSKYTDQVAIKIVGLKYFQKPLFQSKQYLTETAKRILRAFYELNIDKALSYIRICPGEVFSDAIDKLWELGYKIITTQTTKMAHFVAEMRFLNYLEDIGVPEELLDVNPRNIDYPAFHKSLSGFLRKNPYFKRKYFKNGWYKDKKPKKVSIDGLKAKIR